MDRGMSIHDVFKAQGQPTVTYVKRQDGVFEKQLSDALDSKGVLCLLTGPSKTGKTTLYTQVASEKKLQVLTVRCDAGLSATELWRKALESVNFDQVSEYQKQKDRKVSSEGKISGTLGWAWLAGITGEVSTETASKVGESEIRRKILSNPSPDHIIPILKYSPYILVIEDFHYLRSEVQRHIFQQWKAFVDNEVSVIVLGTTHHAVDLAYANKDLIGRIGQVDLGTWESGDLRDIVKKGFDHLKIPVSKSVIETIAAESVGLPIITQSTCLQLLTNKNFGSQNPDNYDKSISQKDAFEALHHVAVQKYNQFSAIYDRLTHGPRKRARRYNTYELVLSAFALDPLTFSLNCDDIDERLKKLPINREEVPPPPSVDSMLKALGGFQRTLGVELLEWHEKNQRLYILEPSFLFYLRWRKTREEPPSMKQVLTEILLKLGEIVVR